ncbi:surfeit protein 1 [Zopfochytrium polystomum]|nr:surfeit protein 1 [Zopfochytrium polystomum]
MVPVVTLGLGSWQLYRLQWKLQLIDSAKARMTGEPIPLEEATKIADHAIHEFQAVKAHGRFRHDMEIHLGLRSRGPAGDQRGGGLLSSQQSAGYFIFTPLETPSGRILVNRGWVPREQKDPRTRSGAQVQNDVDVVGAWRTGENVSTFVPPRSFPTNDPERNQWYSIDLEMMAASTGSLPVLLDLLAGPEANNSITELPGAPLARVSKVNLTNNHMSYSITWSAKTLIAHGLY